MGVLINVVVGAQDQGDDDPIAFPGPYVSIVVLKSIFLAHPDLRVRSKAVKLLLAKAIEGKDAHTLFWCLENSGLDRRSSIDTMAAIESAASTSIVFATSQRNLGALAKLVCDQRLSEAPRLEAARQLTRLLRGASSSIFTSGTVPKALFVIASSEDFPPHVRLSAQEVLSSSASMAVADYQSKPTAASLLRIARNPAIPDSDREDAARKALELARVKDPNDPSVLFVLASDPHLPEGTTNDAAIESMSFAMRDGDLRTVLLLWCCQACTKDLKGEMREWISTSVQESKMSEAAAMLSVNVLVSLSCDTLLPSALRWALISELLSRLESGRLSNDELLEIILVPEAEWILVSKAMARLSITACASAKELGLEPKTKTRKSKDSKSNPVKQLLLGSCDIG